MLRRILERYRLAVREARFVRVSLLLALGLVLLGWGLALWFVLPRLETSPFFALHYTIYFGVDRIGAPWRLLAYPALGTLILLANLAVSIRSYERDRLTAAFLMALTVLLEALLLFTTFLTVLLNL